MAELDDVRAVAKRLQAENETLVLERDGALDAVEELRKELATLRIRATSCPHDFWRLARDEHEGRVLICTGCGRTIEAPVFT